ncbi:hypothetical protein BN946_scf185028.g18 [Trametes cinnabarina]|uniref:Heterokaryon incompatibility domain-containing protein n=1 Tax=Pycnoporus cinnabarinus TaxID=5643 RepID=A0A060SQF3_PYCCI|nr:hypothetical protein BN946_scf185028.g18 [Trametes cinnabarina]
MLRLLPYTKHSREEHGHCGYHFCALETITDLDVYRPRHVEPSCECQNVIPDLDAVLRLLRQGVVPTILYDGAVLHVLPSGERPYVAISHVWSQCMGSTTESGLPTCLLQRIAGLAHHLLPEHGGAFWMDSLCVPEAHDERMRAIMRMSDTYRNAAKALIVDDSRQWQCIGDDGERIVQYVEIRVSLAVLSRCVVPVAGCPSFAPSSGFL